MSTYKGLLILETLLREGSIQAPDRVLIERAIKEIRCTIKEAFICTQCGKPFDRLRSQLTIPDQEHVFCKMSCYQTYRRVTGVHQRFDYVCENCGKPFTRKQKSTAKHTCCSRKCTCEYRTTHRGNSK